MDILLDNLSWMAINIFLAFLGVAFGYIFLNFKNKFLQVLFFILWVLFVPNTIYLVTDIKWIPEQFPQLEFIGQTILIGQYAIVFVLGILTYILAMNPLEKLLLRLKIKDKLLQGGILILANYLIALGVTMGRIERLNSWDIFLNPFRVINKTLNIFTTREGLVFFLLFGVAVNVLYFIWKKHNR